MIEPIFPHATVVWKIRALDVKINYWKEKQSFELHTWDEKDTAKQKQEQSSKKMISNTKSVYVYVTVGEFT